MTPDVERDPTPAELLARAKEAGAPLIYANSFMASIGLGDILLVMERNAEPVATVNLSYTLAKSLSVSLGLLISQIEERAGRDIMTTGDIEKLFSQGTTQ